jgi:chaperonin GroES
LNRPTKAVKMWQLECQEWLKLAKQTIEPKTYPWPGASNVKYPLLSTAAMQFAARAYPSAWFPLMVALLRPRPLVRTLMEAKTNVPKLFPSTCLWQLMYEMDGWEEDMDKMLIMLPIIGTMFKKTYGTQLRRSTALALVMPSRLIVDYWSILLSDAERISEIIELSPRKVKEAYAKLCGLTKILVML